jgi:hypothetical protein
MFSLVLQLVLGIWLALAVQRQALPGIVRSRSFRRS